MNQLVKHTTLFISLLLYVALWYLLNPTLGYLLDSDAVSYLTIANRVAEGDYLKSINGLWSPMNSWLVAIFIKNGFDAWTASKYLNFVFGFVILIQSYFLFAKFEIGKWGTPILQSALSIIMVYMVYFQMFGDVLQLIFLFAYLDVIWKRENIKIQTAVICGIWMGLAFYAKAYSFFFFGIHWLVVLGYSFFQKKIQLKSAITNYLVGVLTMLCMMSFWSFALYQKYHQFSLSGFAGKLNMSWYINSGKSFKSDINVLIPPSYEDSPSFWEDPYLSQDNLSSPTTSIKHFFKWTLRVVHTCIVAIFCFQEISFFALALLTISIYFYFFRKSKFQPDSKVELLILTIGVLPLGYLMMHIETRYIWANIILLMLLSGRFLNDYFKDKNQILIYRIAYFLFGISFLIFPIYSIQNLQNKNKDLFEIADYLNQKNIHGKFTSNLEDAGRMWVVAYLSKNQFYTIEKNEYTEDDLKSEINRYGVEYYFLGMEKNKIDIDIESMEFVGQTHDIKIYKIN